MMNKKKETNNKLQVTVSQNMKYENINKKKLIITKTNKVQQIKCVIYWGKRSFFKFELLRLT